MVKRACFLQITITVWLISAPALGDTVIRSVHVSSETQIQIKPCEPVFVSLEVSTDVPPDKARMREAPVNLAHRIVINGVEHLLQYNANPVATFIMDRASVTKMSDDTQVFQVIVMMYWNLAESD